MLTGYKFDDLKSISECKLADAVFLLNHGRWSNSYYLAGYCVEIALKACVAKQIVGQVVPLRSIVDGFHSHDFRRLAGLAGLMASLKHKESEDNAFASYWALAQQWEPSSRYESTDKLSAQYMIHALTEQKSGVYQWIRTQW
jgi:HEPN domain-containing protein